MEVGYYGLHLRLSSSLGDAPADLQAARAPHGVRIEAYKLK
jgi:hypothetical protein